MVKSISFLISLVMLLSPAVAITINHDPKDSEISRLTAEKQRKYRELKKCVDSVKGLQIAGISTLGLTTAGIALNASQADKKKTLDNKISATSTQIEKKKQEIEAKRIREEQERAERERLAQAKAVCDADNTKMFVNGRCVDKPSSQNQQTVSVVQTQSNTTADNTVDVNQAMESDNACQALAAKKTGTECYQDSDNKWKIRWKVKEGDSCPISDCFDPVNTSTCKYVWVSNGFVCVAATCKTGYKVFGHMCQKEDAITCDETRGEIVSSSGDSCIKCAEGYIANNGNCERCPLDKKPVGNRCEDYSCSPSEFKTWGDCTKCQQNYIVEDNHCVACPGTKKAENNRCVDFSCPSNMIKSFGECVTCFENLVPNADQSGCEDRQ